MNRRQTVTAAAAVALLLAACGSSSHSSGAGSAGSAAATATAPGTSSTTQTASTTTTSVPQARPTLSPSVKPCVAADLALTALGQQGGLGHGELGFSLRNTSSTSCRTGGYPGVLFLDQPGRALPTVPTRVTRDFFGTVPVTRIVLRPRQSASFRLGTTHEAQAGATCTTAAGLQVIPPNDTATLRTTVPNGAYECQKVTVSPLRPGVTAYP